MKAGPSETALPIELDDSEPFYRLSEAIPENVRRAALACIDAQRDRVPARSRESDSSDAASLAVSEAALADVLASGVDVHGIASDAGISDVLVINAPHIADSIRDEEIARLRHRLDRAVASMMRRILRRGRRMIVLRSGHFWYPPGSHMGWHTNNRAPGWRAYLTHAKEPGRSFFRYRHPESGEIVTSEDGDWDLRIFRVDPVRPLWHAVYSDTDRFSFGYTIIELGVARSLVHQLKGVIRR